MGDIAQILSGITNTSNKNDSITTKQKQQQQRQQKDISKSLKLTGMSREMLNLVSGSHNTTPSTSTTNKNITSSTYSRTSCIEKTSMCLPPIAPSINKKSTTTSTSTIIAGSSNNPNDNNSKNKPARKWVWAPFTSSARSDGLLLYHFVRAGVEYPDYPYARFDIHMDGIEYTNDEYEKYLIHTSWSKSETDRLVDLVKIFELRWPVIYDRWVGACDIDNDDDNDNDNNNNNNTNTRSMEELQHRYYSIASTLTQLRVDEVTEDLQSQQKHQHILPTTTSSSSIINKTSSSATTASTAAEGIIVSNLGTGSTNTEVFNLQKEIERKKHLTALWNRTKEEEAEEALLKQQLKLVEMQIRKLKKAGLHNLPAAHGSTQHSTAGKSNTINQSQQQLISSGNFNTTKAGGGISAPIASPEAVTASILSSLNPYFASAGPVPTPGIPYLQSHRCITPATGGSMGLNKSLISKMENMLKELNVSSTTIKGTPTKRICDLYDVVRKNVLTMLMLQKIVKKKESEVISKKNKLAKFTHHQQQLQQQQLQQSKPISTTTTPTSTITTTLKPTTHGTNTITTISSQKIATTAQQQQQIISQQKQKQQTNSSLSSSINNTKSTSKSTLPIQQLQQTKTTTNTTTATTTGKKTSRKRAKKSDDGDGKSTKPRKRKIKKDSSNTAAAATTVPMTSSNNVVITSKQQQVKIAQQQQPIIANNVTTNQGINITNNSLQQQQSYTKKT